MASVVGESSKRNSAHPASYLRASLLLLLFCHVFAAKQGATCNNPDGVEGTCILVRSCPSLLSALKKDLPQATVEFLRKSHCGFQGSDPLVCCTPNSPPPAVTTLPQVAAEDGVTEDVSQHQNLGLLPMNICGPNLESRIFRGPMADLMELPWMALLAYTGRSGSPYYCAGTLINDRYVLTAANCVTGLPGNIRLVSVRLGEYNLSSPIDCQVFGGDIEECAPAPQDIPVEKVIPHPRFVGVPNYQHDVALIRLSRPADLTTDAVLPICLPITLAQRTENVTGKIMVVSGWGISRRMQPTTVLNKWSVRVMPYPQCSEAFSSRFLISADSQICASVASGNRHSCSGDSGSPITGIDLNHRNHRIVQHGILSLESTNCFSVDNPGVYSRVGHYMKWILDTIEP